MSVSLGADGHIVLTGDCPNEEAELLLQMLVAAPGATVDWRQCTNAHAAVIQVLMAARPEFIGPPAGDALARWVQPHVAARAP
jgi:hypothetical protein